MSKKIGFIGLGNMGAPMAANLAKAGHSVTGYDVAGTTAEGVTAASNLESAVAGMDVVITMLPNGSILRQVAAQVLPHMERGSLFMDCSTVDVESAKNTSQAAEDAGILAI
ncbi:NAD(P)-binding domain-containing protein, partial [Tateyamaria sp.]|uniref:NAD(P)-binding domain-containing protein n=1 Tax=Tateyamaria sp. TaxID=1929288 RepID=UPI0032DC3178